MYNQEEIVFGTLGIMASDDKPALLDMLKKSGSLVTELSTREEILDASVKALKDSDTFRKLLTEYMTTANNEYQPFSYFERYDSSTGKGGSRMGNFLRSTFSPEVKQAIVASVVAYGSTALQNKANQAGNKQAMEYTKAEADRLDKENANLELKKSLGISDSSGSGDSTKKRKWVLPVAIIGGIVLIGGIFLYIRKRK